MIKTGPFLPVIEVALGRKVNRDRSKATLKLQHLADR